MLVSRVLSALIGIPIILLSMWWGVETYTLVIFLIVVLGALEFSELLKKKGISHARGEVVVGAFIFPLMAFWGLWESALHLPLSALLLYSLLSRLFSGRVRDSIFDVSTGLLGPLYTGLLPSYLILLRKMEGLPGLYFSFLALIIAWSNDTAAYFVGVNAGRRKLCLHISPKKTVEGAVGGLVGCLLFVFLMNGIMLPLGWGISLPIRHLLAMAIVGCLAAELGDLVESMLKRDAGVKDSGNVIPGHGGVLDRFDSLFFVAPVIYYYVKLVIGL